VNAFENFHNPEISKMSIKSNQNMLNVPPPVRRGPRESATLFIAVFGFDLAGHFFTDHTVTVNISEDGCCFRLNREVPFDTLLAIQTLDHNSDALARPALYQIAWMERMARGATVGAARLQGDSMWH
jgi:hypothetical protein